MPKKATIETFNALLAKVAEALTNVVARDMRSREWKKAIMDVRTAGKGSHIKKLRVELANGTVVSSLSPPPSTTLHLLDAWKIKDKLFPDKWYGLKITVFPDGKCETEFNHRSKMWSR